MKQKEEVRISSIYSVAKTTAHTNRRYYIAVAYDESSCYSKKLQDFNVDCSIKSAFHIILSIDLLQYIAISINCSLSLAVGRTWFAITSIIAGEDRQNGRGQRRKVTKLPFVCLLHLDKRRVGRCGLTADKLLISFNTKLGSITRNIEQLNYRTGTTV